MKYIGDFKIPDYHEDYIPVSVNYDHEFTVAPDGSLENTFSIGYVKPAIGNQGTLNARQTVRSVKNKV